jgi:hypothetical protein
MSVLGELFLGVHLRSATLENVSGLVFNHVGAFGGGLRSEGL